MGWTTEDLAGQLSFSFVLTSHDDNVLQDSIFGIVYISAMSQLGVRTYTLYD